jgi:hypothetical protein
MEAAHGWFHFPGADPGSVPVLAEMTAGRWIAAGSGPGRAVLEPARGSDGGDATIAGVQADRAWRVSLAWLRGETRRLVAARTRQPTVLPACGGARPLAQMQETGNPRS